MTRSATRSRQAEAELAILAQQIQLNALYRAFQDLESQLYALESESARQSAELDRIEELVRQLRANADSGSPYGAESASNESPVPSPLPYHEASDTAGPTGALGRVETIAFGGSWESYLQSAEQYISDRGVEVTGDPLAQLMPPDLAAAIRTRFSTEFLPAPWDRWDVGAISLAVLVGALTDYLLVATPGGSFMGQPQRASPVTAWLKEQSKALAPKPGAGDITRNVFQNWVANLTTAAEGWAKVPYDVVNSKVGLTPNVHRLASLGHDPLLGLVFGVGDILSGTCTFIDKSGAWSVVSAPGHDGSSNVLEAILKVVVHGPSDVFTAQGLPAPFLAPFQLIGMKSGFNLKEGGDPVPVKDVARYMYSNGYDLRHFMTMSISPAIAEVILWAYHGLRAQVDRSKAGKEGIAEKLRRGQMIALTHGALASANILKTALYGWNPMALNLAQFAALARRLLSLMKLAAERDRMLRERLDDGWKALLVGAETSLSGQG